ncbi:hypothetical protein [Candidatus Xiphinematobacter sp. Idaho Grape]|uniref:hypothetical protein n=1 Tax=Candidatus Xiphinematobacter sp. Idaho Grape TaxID=1704307 RepID=UPI00130E0117|nr:hypothetical protein [Candidatus Xiphinematobacter sp. Idaho Grape]
MNRKWHPSPLTSAWGDIGAIPYFYLSFFAATGSNIFSCNGWTLVIKSYGIAEAVREGGDI